MHPVFGSIVVTLAVVFLFLFLGYRLSGRSVFDTAGHTSSEFKALCFVYAAATINWLTAAFTGGAAGVDASWWVVGMATVAYIIQRGAIKFGVGPCRESDKPAGWRPPGSAVVLIALLMLGGCGSTAGPREIAHFEQSARNAEAFSVAVQKIETPSASDWTAVKKWVAGQATQMRALADWSTGKRPALE